MLIVTVMVVVVMTTPPGMVESARISVSVNLESAPCMGADDRKEEIG